MAETLVEQDPDIEISCIEEELRQLADLHLSSSSESDTISEDEDSQRKLQDFVELSEKFLDEFTILEAEYDTERTCEERAEEHATQIQEENEKQNSTDTRITTPILCEQPVDAQPVVTGDQSMTEVDTDASHEDQRLIEDLKEKIQKLSEEKEQIASELQELRIQMKRLNKELEDERLEKEVMSVKLGKNQNKFLRLNRVSLAVTREYADALDQLEMEQSLRQEAESYASKVLKEKKAISRQSMILMQNVQPNEMLMKALDDVRLLTTVLESTKQELQTKILSLEFELSERPTKEEFLTNQEDLKVANTEKSKLEEEVKVMKEKCTLLEERVKSLEELQEKGMSVNSVDDDPVVDPPITLLSPPPPPPSPPPLSKTPEDPLALLKQRRELRGSEGPPVTDNPNARADAVREMMERIKSGVTLRPARNDKKDQAAVTNKRKTVISELQGILLDAVRKPARRASRRRISRKAKDSELESVLQRRRRIVDDPQKAEKTKNDSKSLKNIVLTDDPRPLLVTPLGNEDKLSSEKQTQILLVQENSQKKQPEIRVVMWQ